MLGTHFTGCCRCREVAVVGRLKYRESKCVDLPPGRKKVAVVGRWPLVEVQLYDQSLFLIGFLATAVTNGNGQPHISNNVDYLEI